MKRQRVFGTSGFNGGGKDTLAEAVVKNCELRGFEAVHMSLSDALRVVVRNQRGMEADAPVPRELLGATSNELVAERGHAGALVLAVCEQLDQEVVVLSSVRRVGEAMAISDLLGGHTLFADASDAVRLSRLIGRNRGDEFIGSMDDLLRTEYVERYGDPTKPNDPGVMCVEGVRSYILQRHGEGHIIQNEGTTLKLDIKVDQLLDTVF